MIINQTSHKDQEAIDQTISVTSKMGAGKSFVVYLAPVGHDQCQLDVRGCHIL